MSKPVSISISINRIWWFEFIIALINIPLLLILLYNFTDVREYSYYDIVLLIIVCYLLLIPFLMFKYMRSYTQKVGELYP